MREWGDWGEKAGDRPKSSRSVDAASRSSSRVQREWEGPFRSTMKAQDDNHLRWNISTDTPTSPPLCPRDFFVFLRYECQTVWEQQTVAFSATILDPLVKPQDVPETVPDPIDELKMKNERHLGRYTAYGSDTGERVKH